MSASQRRRAATADRPWSRLGDVDLHLFNEGRHDRLYEVLGAHPAEHDGTRGTAFAVWAPNAEAVAVIGDFNAWHPDRDALVRRGDSGIWEGFVAGAERGQRYKFQIRGHGGDRLDKADPFALRAETPPDTASVVWTLDHDWSDESWMRDRARRNDRDFAMSIYEVHLGSWRADGPGGSGVRYAEVADRLADHVEALGFTHVELLPIMEHPFYGSWGYQVTGYFAPTSRYGDPQDFMQLVDRLHQRGIGVILDWVPAHFPTDAHGLGNFDGTSLFEHADPRQGFHPDWKSFIFNYGRNEVRSFLLSSARFWLDRYHIDGLRVDGVASMLYLDYSREAGQWIPNRDGGRENLEAIALLEDVNRVIDRDYPDVQTIAEESTSWPMVSRPIELGGLGFGMKWDMGWMHDTLEYFGRDPIHRRHHHDQLTFRAMYAFHENFVLPLSHDEVVHGKGSLLGRMPGDDDQRFANLRVLFGYMWACPGKKMLFMGGEFAQLREWAHDRGLDWHLRDDPRHAGIEHLVHDLNRRYREYPALHELDHHPNGFEWIDVGDATNSVLSFLRRDRSDHDEVVVVLNLTPQLRENHRIGVPHDGVWQEALNTDAKRYGGRGRGNLGTVEAVPVAAHGRPFSVNLELPPLSAVWLRRSQPTV